MNGMLSNTNAAQQARPESEIEGACSRIASGLNRANNLLDTLRIRIDGALVPSVPQPPNQTRTGVVQEVSGSPLGRALTNHAERINDFENQLDDMLSRLRL